MNHKLSFLTGGGEMGALIRNFDWDKSPLGPPAGWPPALRTTIGILLHSRFPMFLMWGGSLTCFYNDAFRPSFGAEGKHPRALGRPAQEVWADAWEIISPLITQVLSGGEAVWRQDQLVPFYRNGKIEPIYWTFSYSAVPGDDGTIAGVFVACNETTAKVSQLASLQRSREELSFAIEAAEMGTFDYNPITNQFLANSRLIEWFGLRSGDGIDLDDALKAIADKDRARVLAAIQEALQPASNGKYNIEYSIIHPVTGKETIVQAKGRAWFGTDSRAYRLNGTLLDVTEESATRRSLGIAQKKLEESERKLRLIIRQAPVSMAIFMSPDYITEVVNNTALELWGRTEAEVLNRPILEAMPELIPQGIGSLLDEVYRTGKPFRASERPVQLLRDGVLKTNYLNFVYDPVYSPDGAVEGIMTVGINVTDQVLARRLTEESEQQVRNIVNNAPFPIGVYTGREMRITLANQSILDVWGKGNDVIGKLYSEVLPELENQQIFQQLEQVFTSGVPFEAKNQYLELVVNGERKSLFFNYTFTPLHDVRGDIYGVMNTAADVTDLNVAKRKVDQFAVELEREVGERTRQLEEKNRDLEQSNAELQSFTYVASHDLQEPLRKIQIFAGSIGENERDNLTAQGQDYLDRMMAATRRMRRLIEDLLSYSRIKAAGEGFQKMNLTVIAREVVDEMKERIHSLEATVDIQSLGEAEVIPFQFHQLFQNLISNSLKFAAPGRSPVIRLRSFPVDSENVPGVELPQGENFLHLQVSDNGIGFDAAYNEKIFQVFQRLNDSGRYEGTGIGLSIVKKIVENHKGFIQASGVSGSGAQFDIYLPLW